MDLLLEILKYSVPAVVVLVGMLMVMRENQKKTAVEERYKMLSQTLSEIVPLRLQAYERAVLYLERISPENLLLRVDGRGKTARVFQAQLLMEIRAEYEHNIAQQIYISNDGWGALVQAKEQLIQLINQSTHELKPDAGGVELGKQVLGNLMDKTSPTTVAIRTLKSDIQGMFRA